MFLIDLLFLTPLISSISVTKFYKVWESACALSASSPANIDLLHLSTADQVETSCI